MTGCLSVFCTYVPCGSPTTVFLADGSLTQVAGIGNIRLSPFLTLFAAFYVPALKCNLISVTKLTRDSKCVAKFMPSSCQFQDLLSGKTIGNAKVHDGLYYFKADPGESGLQSMSSNVSLSVSSGQDVMLWHRRLGHPSFTYLKKLFPSLFDNQNFTSLNCEMCQFAKHTRTSFHPNRINHPHRFP